jgi:cyclophilin family peptidyl-prolyl cis-trans isomerase
MTAVPPQLEGAQTANQIELLWEKHRRTITTVFWVAACAVVINYGFRYYMQWKLDEKWGAFAAALKLQHAYAPEIVNKTEAAEALQKAGGNLAADLEEQLATADLASLEAAVSSAAPEQVPFFLWMVANKAKQLKDWDKAISSLDRLERDYKSHSLCRSSDSPIQFRKTKKADPPPKGKAPEPELEPAVKCSAVSVLRAQIERLRGYTEPAQFAKVSIPADSPKFRIKFTNGKEVVFAFLKDKAPLHFNKFEELAKANFWNKMRVDEIRRPTSLSSLKGQPYELHFGLEGSKDSDRTKWDPKEPSKNQVDFEENGLSHFAGAVACSPEADGKSAVDRLWICATDAANQDGQRVVVGYVVEGLDVLKGICESSLMTTEEERRGFGKPQDNIEIESISPVGN